MLNAVLLTFVGITFVRNFLRNLEICYDVTLGRY